MRALSDYRSLVFDCDGVLLDSNRVKTDAFYQAALPFGESAANALVRYHVANGGVSRYRKFEYFLSEIVRHEDMEPLNELLSRYAERVREGLLACRVADGLGELRSALPKSNWMIVSGGDQGELREVFEARGLSHYFSGGIFGSPTDKQEILSRELNCGNLVLPAVFLGDSRYDYESAMKFGLDFVFISQWTEFSGWQEYFADQPTAVVHYESIRSLID
ncbi:HAD family hydrolase [Stutzerimonas frequens]|uniref:HAD family hydrolase n=1 Tax=Stutzerimonas frequens TaxID=2968969 RepID=UPI001E561EC6|nr:HAD family hydrolase [Stutzerimonas frequens]MDA0426962.1 HAD hydrolase-like protein [Stutzerimonas frequens]